MKPMTIESIPRRRKTAQASRTAASSSGVSTVPVGGRMRSGIAIRFRRLTSGWLCHGTSKCSEKL